MKQQEALRRKRGTVEAKEKKPRKYKSEVMGKESQLPQDKIKQEYIGIKFQI